MSVTLPADYTPPTLEQRLDAAAEALRAFDAPESAIVRAWSLADPGVRAFYRTSVEAVCRAFAPELFNPTPLSGEQGDAA